MNAFFVNWRNHLLALNANATIKGARIGWDDEKGFSFNSKRWHNGVPSAACLRAEHQHYGVKGDPAPWREAMKMLNDQGNPGLNAISACSFGSVLGPLTSIQSSLVATWSLESGFGKTMAMYVGAGVWGNPVKTMHFLNDTQNSV